MLKRAIIFLLLNFVALAIGGLFTGTGVASEWYASLNQAPWTPPGWVFGAAWTAIMVCFGFHMAYGYERIQNKKMFVGLFAVQWILNVGWNPTFFKFHYVSLGLVVITGLTVLMGYMLIKNWNALKVKSVLLMPYVVWLCIATSLNAYILFNN